MSQQYVTITKQARCNKNDHVVKDQPLHLTSEMCHAHYEEPGPKRSFFMVEAFRGSVQHPCCLLATGLT